MVSKNNIEMKYKKMRDEKQRFSIRKFSVGAASVLIGLSFSLYNGQQASADTVDNGNKSVVANAQNKEQTDNKQSTDTNTQNNDDKTNTNQTQTTVTDDLDHSTVVTSYKAGTPNNASESNKSSENTESKSGEKQAATTETAKTEEAATKEVEAKNTATNDVAKKNDEAAAKTDTKVDVNKTVENEKTEDTTNVDTKNNETQTVKTDEEKVVADNTSSDLNESVTDATTEVSTNTFNVDEAVRNALFLSARAAPKSKVATRALALAAEPEDPNAVTVNDAKGFINAIQNGTATTINVANDLNLASEYDGNYKQRVISHKRDILIQSATPGVKHTIDFSGNSFSMNTQNSVTFKDLDLYERSYWGIVYNAGGYVFDNVNFAGSQLIYTESNINSTLTFKNNVTATAVGSYTSPIDGESRSSQGGNTQQILQFVGGTNHIIFDENSNVTLGTTNSNVLEIDGGTATIDVKNGANVTINPHSKGNPESMHGIGTGRVARAIASNANTTINVDKGANLTINTEKASGDSDVAGALYLNSDATLNVNGDLNINSNGTPSTKNNGYPVYIAGNAAINVGNGGKFNLSATNTGSYSDNLMSISGKGTVKLAPHSNFKISGDGTGALTAINLSSGSTFTSDQPDSFTIDLSANTSTGKSLIKNGIINFSRVKTVTDGNESQPLGKIDVTYDRNGNATKYLITAQDKNTVKQVGEGLANKNLIDLVKAGEDVTLSNLHLSKNNRLTGTVASSGSNNPIYVTVTVGGVSTNVPVLDHYTVYTNTNGTVTSNNVDYAAETASTGGNFSIDLSKLASSLTDDAQVTVTATKDFVEAAQTESVAALRALNTTTLQELVDAAPAEEAKPSYYNATAEAQKAYTDAISKGKTILDNPKNYDQVDVDNAVTAIQNAQDALNGKETNKTELQDAIDQASTVESSDNYTNADSNLQKAYTDAISAGQTVLNKENVTQTEVDNALTTINNAKDALNGDAKKATSKEALQKAVNEAPTVRSTDAAYYNGSKEAKTAYDKAITAGQTVLDNPDATATQITDALNAINIAKGNLKGEATDKSALQTAVDNSATVKESNNYTNADEAQKTAYDNAVTAAQTVLDKTNATQVEVNQALQDLETANNNLNGNAKTEAANKAALEAAVKDAPNVRNTPAYYNGSEEAKKTYNDAINAGQAVLDQANPSASEVKNALNAINAAKDNLKGEATSTEALKTALTNANDAKETGNYTNADQANQEALNNAINAGQDLLKNTNATQAEVDSAAKAITDAINGLNGDTNLAKAKTAATEDIQKALDTKTTQITDATNIDQATKDQLIADAKKAAEDANTAINQATNADAVNTAKTEGTTNINNVTVPSLEDAKKTANKAVDDALTAQTEVINKANNLSDAEKKDLIDKATAEANKAKENIETATTNNEAAQAGQAGVDAIKNIVPTSLDTVKSDANKAIDDALTKKLEKINSANDLTADEKTALTQEANIVADKAKEKITNATTNDAVIEAQNNGVTAIDDIKVPTESAVKEAAKKAVADAATAKNNAIDASNLTDEEKAALKQKVTDAQNAADQEIDKATTNAAVTEAQTNGVTTIDDIKVPTESAVKEAAKKAVADAATAKNNAIDASNLTDEEKAALKQKVTDAQNAADQEIDKATTNAAVTEAQTNGVTTIDDIKVPTESAVKEAAKKAVADAATAKNNAIDASNLTDEEKAALKQKVTDAQNAADQEIDKATTNAAVTEAQTNGVNAINGIEVPNKSDAKEKAVTDLNTAAENAKKTIDQDSNLTDEQKQAAKDQIDSDAKTAQDAINNAKTNDDVKKAVDDGTLAIDKDAANAAIDNAAAGKLKEIQDPLTTEEKQAYTDLINSEATNAKQNIANATTVEEVTTAQTNGVNEINNTEIPTTSSAKDKAIAAINDALQKKTDEINNASNINAQEKTDLINQATEAANAAKNNINNATTNADVDTAQTNGEKAIADVTVPNLSDVKKESIDLINKALDAKTDEINNASNLSQDEKQSLINDATNAATEAINNINQSQTNDDAKAAATTGVQNIENVTIPSLDEAKKNANQAIEDALNTKVNEINNASNLNDTEKQKLVDQATEAATTAKNNVENATTNDDARDAANAGIDNIKGITFTSLEDAKKAANIAIDNALQVKTDEINNASNLSTDEKQDLINQATEVAKNAKDNINNATTNDAVTEAQNKGIADIANVTVPSLDQVKQDAINAIKQVQDAKNKQISAASNLSAEEQKELSDQVDKIANDAIDKINESSTTTNDAVTATRDDAIKQITDLFIPTLDGAQTDALNAIEGAKNAKLNDINNAAHLTDEEKQALVDQTNKAADDATKEIKAAQTNDAVKSAETAGLENINNIAIPTLVQKQQEAIEELNAARDAKNSAIDDATDLTTDEKNSLKDKVQAEYSNAVSNITGATTDEAVTTAKEDGIAAIKDIQIPTKSPAKEQATSDLNTAVNEAKNAIDQDNNLTDEEKQAAKDQIDSDAKKAQEAIDNATTDDEVNTAVDNGKLAIDKDIANAAIDNAVSGKKNEISKSLLTDEEKAALNDEVDEKAQAAKDAINNATTPEVVSTAQENGIKKINDTEVPTESAAKEAAKKAVAEAADAKNNAIDSSNLTDEEKAVLKQEVTEAQNAADRAIDAATTNTAVTEAQDKGVRAIDNVTVPTESAAKEAAKKAVAEAAEAKNNAIDSSNLTAEEKAALKQEVTEAQNAADRAIDAATTNTAVTEAQDKGVKAIDNVTVPTESAAKEAAKKAVAEAAEAKNNAIDSSNLTAEEKAALKQEVAEAQNAANTTIDNATTNAAVTEAEDNGIKAINSIEVPTKSDAKEQATSDLNTAVDEAKKAIDQDSNLTDEEKQVAKDQIDSDAKKAQEAIDTAKTNDDVKKAIDDGTLAIDKDVANAAIDNAVAGKKDEISKSPLTDEEKDALNNQVDQKAQAAKEAINAATTPEAVTNAQEYGIKNINDTEVPPESAAKEAAKKAVAEAAEAKNNAIDSSNLTNEEKAALKQKVTEAQTAADQAIDNATTNAEVTEAKDNGVKTINGIEVPTKSTTKEQATTDLNKEVENAKKAVDQDNNLTDEEKQAAKDQIDSDAKKAQDAINNAKTNDDVKKAVDDGKLAIDKDVANAAIDNAVAGKKAEISKSPLTDEEKTALNNEVDEKANTAKDAINNATTSEAVISAQESGIKNINDTEVPAESAAKQAAKEAVAKVADEKNAAIDSSNLTDEEKAALKQEVTDAQNAANQAIDNATTDAAVTDAEENGIKAINSIEVPTKSTAKDQATTDLNNEVDEAKKAIDQDNNLTDEQKQAAKDQIDSDAKKAQEAIDNAKSNDDVKKAIDDGTLAIDKDVANAAIDNAVAGKKSEISKSSLTDEEKAALNNEVDQKAQEAKEAINNATTPETVTNAQEDGIKNINETEVSAESAAKQAAKEAVAKAADEKNSAIDSSNLTAEEKAALKQEVTDAQNAANTAIDNATTNAAVTEAEDNGVKTINGIEVPTKSTAKDQATTDLNNQVDEAKKAVDQDTNLTDKEKQAAKDQIDSDAKKAQEAIDNAKTNDDVKKAINDGTLAIDKDVANAAIDNAVAGKKDAISKSPLTDEEKAALNNEVDEKAQVAKEAINAGTTSESVTEAQNSGIKAIDDVTVPTESAAKETAKKAVAEAAEAKNNAIDSSNLTDEEKAVLKQEVSDAQNAANTAIDNATTNAAVTEAQNKGIDTINSIEISAKSAAREEATTDLNNQVDEAKKAIDQDTNLTDEQKQAAKDQIDSDSKKAQEAIDNAKSNEDVKKAVEDGKLAIDKDVANAAIDNAVAGKLKEINDSLTNEEKQAYTDLINNEADNAKQKIAEATTPEEVTRAQEEGVKNINNINVPTTSLAKDAANAAIDQALKNKKDEINNATNISSEEKTDLINQATEAANIAKDNINKATTNSEVETAQVGGEKAIADVTVPGLSDIKKESIDLINKALNEKQDEINNASNLSQDEKQELIDQAKKVATEAIDEINNAQTNDEAKQAADTGVKNIENVSIPSIEDAKKNATQAIDDALNSKKNEINNASNLTDSEKTDLINQATEIANAAKDAINSATTNTAVESAEDKGVADINNIHFTNLEDSKKAANNAIEDALNTKKDEIHNASNLSDSEKAKLINQATEIAQKAHDAINNATTNSAVTAAENKGIEDIANVNVPSLAETKQAAIAAIKQVQNAKNSQIEEAKNLSADEQKNLIDQVNKIAQDAINKLNDSATTTNEVITDTRDKAIDQITNLFIPTLDSVQKDAQEAINSAKEAKIGEINKADNLTDQMKQNLIDQVNQVVDNATKAINNAQTNDDVKEAEIKGLEDINSIQVPSLVESKDDAIKEIDDALEKKTDEINAADLDQKQKDELISQITDIATETKNKVFNATTNAEVEAETEAGIKAIEAVKIPARTADNSNTESHVSSTNVTPDHNNEENNTAQNTNQVSTNTESESKEQTVITNSVQPKRNAIRHKNGAPVNKKATLPQTGKKDNSNLTLAGAALLGLAGVFSLFGLGDKRKKNK